MERRRFGTFPTMRSKKSLLVAMLSVLTFSGLLLLAVTGCSGLEETSAEEFLKQAEQIQEVHSAKSTRFIGATSRAAYLEYWTAVGLFGARTKVLWVPLSELPPEVVDQLKSGSHPWQRQPGTLP